MAIKKVMVIGAGQMGSGIAQVCAQSGYEVLLNDVNREALQKGMQNIEKLLTRSVDKERISEQEKSETMNRLNSTTDIQEVKNCDMTIEAIVENMDVKTKVFRQLDEHAPEHAILATNTSSLPITEIAASTNRAEQVIGMHFMNPVPVMKLVEVIRGLQTSDETYGAVADMAKKLSKTSVEVNDYPGFAANRILMPMINEAIFALHEGVASVEDIDTVMKLGMNHPMGPLTLADFIGLDTCLYIMEVLHEGFGDSKYRPCPLLRKYVNAGWHGKKSGRGFYQYS
ncbi:3-hydroxybutyryl-CoA dehydrogenase [Lentibacillus amyloliquefaciens]|uniref:3-hydroxybutyryl-CoA dehydrogenase n=1 Tax=Lentibacillus amyloliquefaciens TaxID=1472767 RepID=A0A0U4FVQ1_9BACI|nr:3-hydroxybutyryl-CoA dehydrogenase [Lentibacillus amyloliquefaciens]ALX49861.1 3-hydroxybutyryl-CoA dehydrogenase [Lentibacillus amyloliquefaciens]